MADIQVTEEIAVELNNFYNVDLFQRGYYQLRCHLEIPNKLTRFIECELKEDKGGSKSSSCLFKAFVDSHAPVGISRTFEVYYKHEDVQIRDNFIFKVHLLLDGSKLESLLPQKLQLVLDLYFAECSRRYPATPKSLEKVSSQTVDINMTFGKSFHSSRPILFDYFHLGALNLTIHSCLTSVRQPWSAALKALHPIWSGKAGNVKQYCYNALFGKSSNMQPNQTVDVRQKGNASFLHRKLCLQLLRLYEQMLTFYHKSISFLPDYAQMRLSKVDIQGKLEVLNSEFDSLSTAEELYGRMGDDMYLLSTELSLLWTQFLEQFTFEEFLRTNLESVHHKMRIQHMREAFFTEDHPWLALCTSHELSASQQTRMGAMIKNSLYYQLIPPVDLACVSLDGDNSTMPIIFEDRYIPGKTEEDLKKEIVSMTVQEKIVGEDFVDMDVSIENIEDFSGYVDNLHIDQNGSSSSSDTEENQDDNQAVANDNNECLIAEDNDFYRRKSILVKKYSKSISEEWDMSKEKLRKSIHALPETNLTGPDYCEDDKSVQNTDQKSSVNSAGETKPVSPSKDIKTTSKIDNKTVNNKTLGSTKPISDTSTPKNVMQNISSGSNSSSPKTRGQSKRTGKDSPSLLDLATGRNSPRSVANVANNDSSSRDSSSSVVKGTDSSSSSETASPKSPTYKSPDKETAVFYAKLEKSSAENSPRPSLGEDALLSEGIDTVDNHFDESTEKKVYSGATGTMIGGPPSPTDQHKPKLWSCFPAIKSGSKRNSYKMVMQSPPYMPVSRENTSRFQRAKENMLSSFNFHGHQYSHLTEVAAVKPYFTQRVIATTENVHLVVCVHGLDGNSGDLRLVKCYLEMALPRANLDFLMSEVNQEDTFDDIDEMTARLVREIINYIDDQKLDVCKLSFVGHSLGNIIIRNSVTHSLLFEYRNKLHTFLSLSGPHLGMQFHTSNLVSTGMWLIQKWKKAGSLVQLALNDAADPRDTFMYRLSLTNGFQYFKNVLLVSSVQDHYVPFHSARVEMSKQAVKDNSEGGRVYKEMLDNIMNPLLIQEEINIVKYSVYHPMASSANTFIGRAAHIAMLDSELFLEKFILITASKYFA